MQNTTADTFQMRVQLARVDISSALDPKCLRCVGKSTINREIKERKKDEKWPHTFAPIGTGRYREQRSPTPTERRKIAAVCAYEDVPQCTIQAVYTRYSSSEHKPGEFQCVCVCVQVYKQSIRIAPAGSNFIFVSINVCHIALCLDGSCN